MELCKGWLRLDIRTPPPCAALLIIPEALHGTHSTLSIFPVFAKIAVENSGGQYGIYIWYAGSKINLSFGKICGCGPKVCPEKPSKL